MTYQEAWKYLLTKSVGAKIVASDAECDKVEYEIVNHQYGLSIFDNGSRIAFAASEDEFVTHCKQLNLKIA